MSFTKIYTHWYALLLLFLLFLVPIIWPHEHWSEHESECQYQCQCQYQYQYGYEHEQEYAHEYDSNTNVMASPIWYLPNMNTRSHTNRVQIAVAAAALLRLTNVIRISKTYFWYLNSTKSTTTSSLSYAHTLWPCLCVQICVPRSLPPGPRHDFWWNTKTAPILIQHQY